MTFRSKTADLKELRFTLPDGEWRISFAFDPWRRAIYNRAAHARLPAAPG